MRSLLLPFVLLACSSTVTVAPAPPAGSEPPPPVVSGELPDAGADADAPRPTPPPLPVIPNQGGPIVSAPEIITLTWKSDSIAADLEAFDDWLVASDTWKTMMAEWGVGPGTHVASYRIPDAPPSVLDEGAVKATIDAAIAAGHVPPPSASRIYAVYPPAGTRVTNFGAEGCEEFQAYHYGYVHASGAYAIYAITPRCADTGGMTPLDFTTWGMSHEIMEASSDPQYEHPAYRIDQQTDATPEAGENADLCGGHPTKIEGHEITRNWSNVAAKAGKRPCVPAPDGPMFGVFPDAPSITIAPGETKTVPLHAYATGPMPAWSLVVYANNAKLTATVSKKTVADGDDLELTVTAAPSFVEVEGANLVTLGSIGKDYNTRRHLIVHQKD